MSASARIKAARAEQWQRKSEAIVTVQLPFPISTNRLWRPVRGRMICTARYRTWKRAAGNEINRQKLGRIKGPFNVSVVLQRKPGKNPDADNCLKCVLDILQEYQVIENDNLAREVHVSFSPSRVGAYVVLARVPSSSLRAVAA